MDDLFGISGTKSATHGITDAGIEMRKYPLHVRARKVRELFDPRALRLTYDLLHDIREATYCFSEFHRRLNEEEGYVITGKVYPVDLGFYSHHLIWLVRRSSNRLQLMLSNRELFPPKVADVLCEQSSLMRGFFQEFDALATALDDFSQLESRVRNETKTLFCVDHDLRIDLTISSLDEYKNLARLIDQAIDGSIAED